MNRIIGSMLVISTVLIGSTIFVHASEAQEPDQRGAHSEDHSHDGMMMGNKSGMHENLEKMKQTMNRIRNTDDPEQRKKLMQQHRQQMHQAMGSMCRMMDDKERGGMKDDMREMNPEMRRKMMQDHMQMMEGMVEQMKMHMEADSPEKQSR